MHMGHYFRHLRHSVPGLVLGSPGFSAIKWQKFVQSGTAMWLASHTDRSQCCDHDMVGGDGTSIGITVPACSDMNPVWVPPHGVRKPFINWGRMNRCCLQFSDTLTPSTAADFRRRLRTFLLQPVSQASSAEDSRFIMEHITPHIPPELVPSVLEVAANPPTGLVPPERKLLRRLLRNIVSEYPVNLMVPRHAVESLKTLVASLQTVTAMDSAINAIAVAQQSLVECRDGLLFDILSLLVVQVHHYTSIPTHTLSALGYLGEFSGFSFRQYPLSQPFVQFRIVQYSMFID